MDVKGSHSTCKPSQNWIQGAEHMSNFESLRLTSKTRLKPLI